MDFLVHIVFWRGKVRQASARQVVARRGKVYFSEG